MVLQWYVNALHLCLFTLFRVEGFLVLMCFFDEKNHKIHLNLSRISSYLLPAYILTWEILVILYYTNNNIIYITNQLPIWVYWLFGNIYIVSYKLYI